MIRRLRDFPSDEELELLYGESYNHAKWDEHVVRIKHSIELLHERLCPAFTMGTLRRVADLSCGDGAIIKSIKTCVPQTQIIAGDYAPAKWLDRVGRIEDTLHTIEPVDLFILTETLEHLEHPASFLAELRKKTRWLFLTTPTGEVPGDENLQHIWEWDVAGLEGLLDDAGFVGTCDILEQPHYTYQIWTCR